MRNVFLSTLFLCACASEDGVKIYNSQPSATITSHTGTVELHELIDYTLVGVVTDGNHSASQLTVTWSSDTRELCAAAVPDVDGSTSCRVALERGESQIKLQVVDPEGSAGITSIDVVVVETEAPTIALLSPTMNGAYYADQLILFSAIIDDRLWYIHVILIFI